MIKKVAVAVALTLILGIIGTDSYAQSFTEFYGFTNDGGNIIMRDTSCGSGSVLGTYCAYNYRLTPNFLTPYSNQYNNYNHQLYIPDNSPIIIVIPRTQW